MSFSQKKLLSRHPVSWRCPSEAAPAEPLRTGGTRETHTQHQHIIQQKTRGRQQQHDTAAQAVASSRAHHHRLSLHQRVAEPRKARTAGVLLLRPGDPANTCTCACCCRLCRCAHALLELLCCLAAE